MDTKEENLKATILNIQRMSTEDGPGIRTTVFFKGCGLRCSWCHNPESISPKPQIQWIENKCIGCGTCIKTCPENALSSTPEGIIINREICTGCGICTEECPTTAMELLGKFWELNELVEEVVKDYAYFSNSEGGITASGGDPVLQAHFVQAFLKKCKERDIHTALDTCGFCSTEALDLLLPYTDLLLYDIKQLNPELHEKYTGHSSQKIFKNILYIRDYILHKDRQLNLWIRTPLIPDATASAENIKAIGNFIASELGDVVNRWELCSFNNLCRDKYRRLGIDWPFNDTQLLSREFLENITAIAKETDVNPDIVYWTGATRVEDSEDETITQNKNPVQAI